MDVRHHPGDETHCSEELEPPALAKQPWVSEKKCGTDEPDDIHDVYVPKPGRFSGATAVRHSAITEKFHDIESAISADRHSDDKTTLGRNSLRTELTLEIPPKRYGKVLRNLRYIAFNVHRRLFSVIFLANIINLIVLVTHVDRIDTISLSNVATASAANLLVAIMIRQDYVVNFIYRICWAVPHYLPLKVRCLFAKVHELGGIHSGMLS